MEEDLVRKSGGRNKGVTKELLLERRAYALSLRQAGLTIESIVKDINSKSLVKKWGTVSYKLIQLELSKHYSEQKQHLIDSLPGSDDAKRESQIAQLEKTIEQMVLYMKAKEWTEVDEITGKVIKRDDWRPFEKITALKELFKMQSQLAEIQNWNLGKKNPSVALQINDNRVLFDVASKELDRARPEEVQKLLSLLDSVEGRLKDTDVDTVSDYVGGYDSEDVIPEESTQAEITIIDPIENKI